MSAKFVGRGAEGGGIINAYVKNLLLRTVCGIYSSIRKNYFEVM